MYSLKQFTGLAISSCVKGRKPKSRFLNRLYIKLPCYQCHHHLDPVCRNHTTQSEGGRDPTTGLSDLTTLLRSSQNIILRYLYSHTDVRLAPLILAFAITLLPFLPILSLIPMSFLLPIIFILHFILITINTLHHVRSFTSNTNYSHRSPHTLYRQFPFLRESGPVHQPPCASFLSSSLSRAGQQPPKRFSDC